LFGYVLYEVIEMHELYYSRFSSRFWVFPETAWRRMKCR